MAPRIRSAVLALATVALMAPGPARAQRRPPPPQSAGSGWAPISAGLRIGYEDKSSSLVFGAGMRIPVIPNGSIQLLPSADITFVPKLKEYEYNLEAVYVYGDRNGGVYAGGGLAWRNTIFDGQSGRQTKQGHTIVVGLVSSPNGRARLGTQIELRWIFVDPVLKPRVFSFGVNLPLW